LIGRPADGIRDAGIPGQQAEQRAVAHDEVDELDQTVIDLRPPVRRVRASSTTWSRATRLSTMS
jgi:hypothetical protein